MNSSRPWLCRTRRAFTLVETLMAITVMGLATVGIVAFMRQGLKMYYADRARVMINRDMRTFTTQMDSDAVQANFFCLYADFNTRTTGSGSTLADAFKHDGEVGDFLLFVYTDPSSSSQGISIVKRLVGYYREPTGTVVVNGVTYSTGPVHRFDTDKFSTAFTPVSVTAPIVYSSGSAQAVFTAIVNAAVTGSISSYPIVQQLSQGLAQNSSGTGVYALFYNLKDRSVMINAQMAESLTEQGTLSQAGNTYNFAVSPRG